MPVFLPSIISQIYSKRQSSNTTLGLPPVPGGVSVACGNYLVGLAERVILERPLDQEDQYFLRYTGHMTDELGLYKDCTLAPNMTYHNCQLGIEVLRESFGVCLSNKCLESDWQVVEKDLRNYILANLSKPDNPLGLQHDYTTLYLNPTYPSPIVKPFDDSYTMGFVFFICFISLVTIYSTIKGKVIRQFAKSKEAQNGYKEKQVPQKSDHFKDQNSEQQSWEYLDFFDLAITWEQLGKYKISSAGQFTSDLLRFLFVVVSFIYQIPFVHAGISKLPVDAVMNAFYNTGAADCNLQLMLFFPDGYLFISGYVCTLAALRAVGRWQTSVSRSPISFVLLYALLLLKRYLKLAFAIGFGMVLVWKVLPLVATGPLSTSNLGCTDQNFFESLIFWNNNIGGTDRMCGIWYWFYAVNMRLYFFLPPIVFLSLKSKKLASALSVIIAVASLVMNFAYNQTNKITEIHPNSGLWIVKVLGCARFHGLSFFLGIAWALSDPFNPEKHQQQSACSTPRSVSDEESAPGQPHPVAQTNAKKHQQAAHRGTGISSRSTHTTMISAANQQLAAQDEPAAAAACKTARRALNTKRAVLGGVCFAIWLATYLIYSYIFQNDNVDIQAWPQWRHSLFNSLGIPILGGMLVPAVYGFASAYERKLSAICSDSRLFAMLSQVYFSLNILGIPLLLLLLFNLASQPFFDLYLVNYSIIWETALAVAITAVLQPLLFRPVLGCIAKLMKV